MSVLLQDALVSNYDQKRMLIGTDQVGQEFYKLWKRNIDILYDLSCSSRAVFDLKTKKEISVKIYDTISEIYQHMIGEVNDQFLRRKADLDLLIIAYTTFSPSADSTLYLTKRQLFRHKLEYLFAREIIVQKLKSDRIIADENEDARLVRRYNTKVKRNEERPIVASAPSPQQSNAEHSESRTTVQQIESPQPSSVPIWDKSEILSYTKKDR